MSRTTVKQAIKSVLQNVSGIKTVFTNLPKNQQGIQFPSIVIKLEKTDEETITLGNPARRHINYECTLYIQTIDATPDEQVSQQTFDDLLDNIDAVIRQYKDLNGNALRSGLNITTDVFDPQLAGQGQAILMRAIKTFNILVEITA